MLRNLKTLTYNPDGLLMNNPDVPWLKDEARINPHNFREAMIAFNAEVLPSGKAYNLKWKGDQVVGISPHESPLCIYGPM